MNVAIYSRKSTDDAVSAERQVEIAREFAASKGWAVVAEFVDNAISGATFDRPGLNRLLAAIAQKPRPFAALVTMDGSRLGREQAETLALQQRITKAGVRIFFYQDGAELLLNTPVQKLVASVNNFGAEDYRHQIVLKTRDALRSKFKAGHAVGGAPFGYTLKDLSTHKVLEVEPEAAAVVRRVFDLYVSGKGDKVIADLLNTEAVISPRHQGTHIRKGKRITGKGWDRNSIARVLANPIYIGRAEWHDKAANETLVFESDAWRIVTAEQWQTVRDLKAKIGATYQRTPEGRLLSKPEAGYKHILSGILRCHECGGALGWQQNAYICRRHTKSAAACSNGASISARQFEQFILRSVAKLLAENPEKAVALIEARQAAERARVATTGDPYEQAQAEAARLTVEIDNLIALAAAGSAPASVLAGITERETKRAALLAVPQTVKPFDRSEVLSKLPTIAARYRALLAEDGPEAVIRAALQRLGIERIIAQKADGGQWVISGSLDLGKALQEVHYEEAFEEATGQIAPRSEDADLDEAAAASIAAKEPRLREIARESRLRYASAEDIPQGSSGERAG
jgi:DNA invertase Pin-like site-specific DNA recombinase